jgi:hypothetical protein
VLENRASGQPFDHGKFAIVVEPRNAPWPNGDPLHFSADRIRWTRDATTPAIPLPPQQSLSDLVVLG